MAQRVTVVLTDDIDGSEGSETLAFTWRNVSYEIDLSERNLAKADKSVAWLIEHARRVGGRGRRGGSGRAAAAGKVDNAAVRAWAQANGMPVSERGRIAQSVLDAYHAAR